MFVEHDLSELSEVGVKGGVDCVGWIDEELSKGEDSCSIAVPKPVGDDSEMYMGNSCLTIRFDGSSEDKAFGIDLGSNSFIDIGPSRNNSMKIRDSETSSCDCSPRGELGCCKFFLKESTDRSNSSSNSVNPDRSSSSSVKSGSSKSSSELGSEECFSSFETSSSKHFPFQ